MLSVRSVDRVDRIEDRFLCILHKFFFDFGPSPIDFGSQPDRESCNFGYIFRLKIDFLQSVDRVDRVDDRVDPIVGWYALPNNK